MPFRFPYTRNKGREFGFAVDQLRAPARKAVDFVPARTLATANSAPVLSAGSTAQEPLSFASVMAEAATITAGLTRSESAALVDSRILMAMIGSERMLYRTGDISDAIAALPDYYSSGVIISHENSAVQDAYREWARRVDLDYFLADSHMQAYIYGGAFLAVTGEGADTGIVALNPKHVAVGRQPGIGTRKLAYLSQSTEPGAMYKEFYNVGLTASTADWNEWPSFMENDGRSVLLNPQRVYYRTNRKLSIHRYGIPATVGAWDALLDRILLGEMVRSTIEGLKTQLRVWTIDHPGSDEIADLKSKVQSMETNRVYDLFWGSNLSVSQVVPGTVSDLLADSTWMRLTARCFRDMGLTLVLSTGERMAGDTVGSTGDAEIQVQVAVTRIQAAMDANLKIARWLLGRYAEYSGDRKLMKSDPPSVSYRAPMLTQQQLIKGMATLLNYGAMSIRTVHEWTGIDSDIELERLRNEIALRGTVIAPYAGFSQFGNGQETTHSASPGRPQGVDTNPANSDINQQNASARRNGSRQSA